MEEKKVNFCDVGDGSVGFIETSENLNRVQGGQVGQMGQLHSAGAAFAGQQIVIFPADGLDERLADGPGKVVVFFVHAESSRQAATVVGQVVEMINDDPETTVGILRRWMDTDQK